MPWTAVFTLVGSMGLSALPLTGGFVGEWLALQSFVTLAGSSEGQGLRLLGALAFVLHCRLQHSDYRPRDNTKQQYQYCRQPHSQTHRPIAFVSFWLWDGTYDNATA